MKLILIIVLFQTLSCIGQKKYTAGDFVPNLTVKKMLNAKSPSSSLKSEQGSVTILDFFGTWCAPCLKALPQLKVFKEKYSPEINILLISTEDENKLSAFISNRAPFSFPVIVDEDAVFTSTFNPPSYPFTLVLDKNLKILSLTHAADLTDSMLEKFISDGKLNTVPPVGETAGINESKTVIQMPTFTPSNNYFVQLSQHFMYAAKTNSDATGFIDQIKNLDYKELLNGLKTDDEKKAFWINLYNAYTNYSLHKNPDQYKKRNAFFKNKNIQIAGKIFSLDGIEHGILRRSKIKWSLGYLNKLFPGKVEKELRVKKLDYRIHFALNCGAKSCPPIAFYNPEILERQLEIATTAYLTGEISYDKEKNKLQLPSLLSWFRRDFGGKQKIIQLLKTKQLIPGDVNPDIGFKKYDWTLYLDNFKN